MGPNPVRHYNVKGTGKFMGSERTSVYTPEIIENLRKHCKARHPLDPAEGLRMLNEIELLQWELECATNPKYRTEAVRQTQPSSSQWDTDSSVTFYEDH